MQIFIPLYSASLRPPVEWKKGAGYAVRRVGEGRAEAPSSAQKRRSGKWSETHRKGQACHASRVFLEVKPRQCFSPAFIGQARAVHWAPNLPGQKSSRSASQNPQPAHTTEMHNLRRVLNKHCILSFRSLSVALVKNWASPVWLPPTQR